MENFVKSKLCSFESHLSVGRGKGWSGEGCWFGAGIIFVGFIWRGAANISIER